MVLEDMIKIEMVSWIFQKKLIGLGFPLISDFTPGVDKIGLAVSGDSGFNRKDFSKDDISFVQGTGDMAAHTLIMFTGEEASNRGYENGVGIFRRFI